MSTTYTRPPDTVDPIVAEFHDGLTERAFMDSLIAYAWVPEGGVSALYYGNRLVQLPVGVLGGLSGEDACPWRSRVSHCH